MNFKLRTIFFIFLISLSNNSFSQNIFDVSLENKFIRDSFRKHFSNKEITNAQLFQYPKSQKFVKKSFNLTNSKYSRIAFHYKKNDTNYTIYSISTGKFFGKDNIDICKSYMKKIVNDYVLKFQTNSKEYESPYNIDDGKSIAYVNDIKIESGKIRMFCVDWSDLTEKKRGWSDNFQLNISSDVFTKWLNNEAYY